MGGIFGYVDFDDRRVDDGALAAMRRAMAHWGRDGHAEVGDSPALLGRCRSFDTPEAVFDRMPHPVNGGSALMTAEARLDNRDELCDALGVAHVDRPMLADTDVIARAYERWGEACASHLHGDWSVAVWDRRTRKAWVARDQHGMTALYYCHDGTRFAFASDKRALLPLLRRGPSLDEEFLAEILIAWPGGARRQDDVPRDSASLPGAHHRGLWRGGDGSRVLVARQCAGRATGLSDRLCRSGDGVADPCHTRAAAQSAASRDFSERRPGFWHRGCRGRADPG